MVRHYSIQMEARDMIQLTLQRYLAPIRLLQSTPLIRVLQQGVEQLLIALPLIRIMLPIQFTLIRMLD